MTSFSEFKNRIIKEVSEALRIPEHHTTVEERMTPAEKEMLKRVAAHHARERERRQKEENRFRNYFGFLMALEFAIETGNIVPIEHPFREHYLCMGHPLKLFKRELVNGKYQPMWQCSLCNTILREHEHEDEFVEKRDSL